MEGYHTPVAIFIIILIAYITVCLVLGAKQVYFDPWEETVEEPEKPANTPTQKGAGPWELGK